MSDAPTKYCQDCGATINARAEICPHCGVRQNSGQISRGHSVDPSVREAGGNKLAAGICAILIGSLGVHKFILGYSTSGLIMLLVSLLTCGIGAIPMGVIGIVEGIIYLTKSDEEFYETYVLQKKEWF